MQPFNIVFKLPDARLFMGGGFDVYPEFGGTIYCRCDAHYDVYRRLRPRPIAFSIFFSVLEAIAFAFAAPSSKISSSSGESINA